LREFGEAKLQKKAKLIQIAYLCNPYIGIVRNIGAVLFYRK
jgi:hypothetical protein